MLDLLWPVNENKGSGDIDDMIYGDIGTIPSDK